MKKLKRVSQETLSIAGLNEDAGVGADWKNPGPVDSSVGIDEAIQRAKYSVKNYHRQILSEEEAKSVIASEFHRLELSEAQIEGLFKWVEQDTH